MTDEATAIQCELATLFALGALDDAESRQFEAHLVDGCPECRHELESLRFTVELLALAPEPVAPPPELRGRLLESVRQLDQAPRQPSGPTLAFEDDGPWKPYSVPGIEYRMLHLDRATREVVMLVRAQPDSGYPMHRHASAEDMFMLRGELRLDGSTYRPGDFIRSVQGSEHGVGETPGGCMFLMRGSIDDLVFENSASNTDGQHHRGTGSVAGATAPE